MRTRFFASILSFVLFLAVPAGAQINRSAGQTERFRVYSYQDRMAGTWAFKFLMPEGWQFQGGINWMPKPWKVAEIHFTVSDPQGTAVMEVYPDFLMAWSNNPSIAQMFATQMQILQPAPAVELLEKTLIPQSRGNVAYQVVNRRSLPDVAQALTLKAQQLLRADPCFAQLMTGVQFQYDVGQVDITYTYGGRQIYESVIARVLYLQNQMQPYVMWGPEALVSLRTDAAFKDVSQRRFLTMLSSYTDNPVFQQKLCNVNLQMVQAHQQQLNNIAELSRYLSRTSNEISDISRSTFEAKDAAYDRVFDHYADSIRGVDTFTDGDIDFKIPVGNEHVWKQGDTIVYTDNPNFNPNTVYQGNWQRLQQRRQ